MSSNMQKLGTTLLDRMRRTSKDAVPTTLELGTVNKNLSITTDGLQAEIPKGDYMVSLMLTGGLSITGGSHSHSGEDHSHSGGSHSHEVSFRGLRAGDRILVAWCGSEPVVIAVVESS